MAAQVVAELRLNVMPYFFFGLPFTGEEDRCCGRLPTFDPFRMVVRDSSKFLSLFEDCVQVVKGIAYRADSHRRAVAITIVGLGAFALRPVVKTAPISTIGIPPIKGLEILNVWCASKNGVGQCNR